MLLFLTFPVVSFCFQGVCAQEIAFSPGEIGRVTLKQTELGTFAVYVPNEPRDVLVLVHGYPWPDGTRTMSQLADHVTDYANRWHSFAAERQLILLVPAFGSGNFLGYRELFGARIDSDEFVHRAALSSGAALSSDATLSSGAISPAGSTATA